MPKEKYRDSGKKEISDYKPFDRCELVSTVTHNEKAHCDYVNMIDRNLLYPANNLAKSVDIEHHEKIVKGRVDKNSPIVKNEIPKVFKREIGLDPARKRSYRKV